MTETPEPTLPKTFDPAVIEAKWAAHWEVNGLFRPHRPDATPYTIVNPPPNVTGALHIGHALDNTLQDVLIRYERLRGKDALWVVGTDHAGIATQMVVERQMAEHQQKRTDMSRDDFIAKVWEWKAESGGQITGQLRRLGCSMDWNREQFTMDPHFTTAVNKVFVELYNAKNSDGKRLLYRDKRLVNWDPGLKTAISDLEVETREVNGKFWHFRYPLADGVKTADGKDYIVVATTRPETMLADMAVAVNASDARYASVVGKHVVLPITGRLIPIITDDHADPEMGSGAVKITPGHDFNDFEVGKRAGFEPRDMLNMLDSEARVKQVAYGRIPDDLIGLDRFDARDAVVAAMDAAGLLELVEDRVIQTPYGDRSGQVIEPWLTDQWYVDAKTLARPAIEAVKSGAIEIVPKSWEKTFFNWMDNIQPWCVSRQLWWGHRIPVWHGFHIDERGHPTSRPVVAPGVVSDYYFDASDVQVLFVAESEEAAKQQAALYYPGRTPDKIEIVSGPEEAQARFFLGPNDDQDNTVPIWRDPDVLDTWFSSALWPFATLGWPENSSPLVGEDQGGGRDASASHEALSASAENPHPNPSPQGGGTYSLALTPNPSPQGGGANAPTPNPSPQPSPARGEGDTLLSRHYPGDVLISGFDILFFWDARMMMQGLHFMKAPPFKTLYLHGLVRAPDGQKMSKSKGNVIDPLGLIDRYGADALRFFMAAMECQGRDIKMDDARLEGYRNFATKLWNAARFCEANGIGASATLAAPPATLPVNRWIIGEVVQTVAAMDSALAALRFDDAANAIYQFAWGTFCDWYIELVKGQIDDETRAVTGWVLDQILVMLHPFIPFITEELWSAGGARSNEIIIAKWPEPDAGVDAGAKADIDWLIALVQGLRGAKAELGIAPGARLPLYAAEADAAARERFARLAAAVERVGRVASVHFEAAPAGSTMQMVVDGVTYALPLEGTIDVAAERARLSKALEAAAKDRDALKARLSNPAFTERAKPEAVAKASEDYAARAAEAERLTAALARLGDV